VSNTGWRTTIRSGNADIDMQMLERHRQSAQQQGMVLHTRNLQDGGFEVAAAPLGAPSPFADPAPALAPYPAPMPMPAAYGYGPPGFAAPQPARQVAWAPGAGATGSCQICGRDAPTKRVTFMQNIGVLVIRFPKQVSGALCRHCIDKYFFEMTGITMLFGWWGMISFFYSLVAVPVNVFTYLGALSLPAPPDDLRSLDAKKTRSVVMIVLGALMGCLAGLWLLITIGLLLSDDPDDVSAGVGNLVFTLILALPSLLLFVFGIVKRVRAGRKYAELLMTGY
jgi:hypothetical protein